MRVSIYLLMGLLGVGATAAFLIVEPAGVEVESAVTAPPPEVATANCRPDAKRTYRGVSVGTFDIAGLVLEMSSNDVQEIMNCSGATDRGLTMKECAADLIAYDRQWRDARERGVVNTKAADRNCVASMVWRERGRRIIVNFVEDVPAHPGGMIVYQVSTEQEGALNEASLQTFRKALIEKYGEPTTDSKTDLVWGSYPDPQLRFFPYAQYYLDLVHRKLKAERDRVTTKIVSDAAPTVEPRL